MNIAVFCDVFPELSETFIVNEIRAMRRQGHEVSVVAIAHARREHRPADLGNLPVTYLEDLAPGAKRVALARLAARHPVRCLRDARDRRTWAPDDDPRHIATLAPVALELGRRGVEHLHVHFASRAAVEALRLGRLLDLSVSVTAHAVDIFRDPRNLERKLREATFATTPCAYNLRYLRELVGPPDAHRIHEIVMGVDPERFRRTRPHPAGRRILAVGRLVEKKGFVDLVDAAALLRAGHGLGRLTIVGAGPLEAALRAQVAELGLDEIVELVGAQPPERVLELLEDAPVLAMPCVVAADGDRDAMPVVVKEALAMEVPVVATSEVGLPEIVDRRSGRLVPPGDPAALAAALDELLHMSPEERADMGQAGRARVIAWCDVDRETGRLLELIADAVSARRGQGLDDERAAPVVDDAELDVHDHRGDEEHRQGGR